MYFTRRLQEMRNFHNYADYCHFQLPGTEPLPSFTVVYSDNGMARESEDRDPKESELEQQTDVSKN
jgi:hypothetical protein